VFLLAPLAYVKRNRAAPLREEDMGEVVGMDDKACQDAELARRKGVSSSVEVSVGAVEVDAPQGHAWEGHPR
jgi:hypothetical protein